MGWDPGDWRDIEGVCPICGQETLQQASWWDDPPEAGGACIGNQRRCTECGYWDTMA